MNNKIKICFIVGDLPPAKCGIADNSYHLLSMLGMYEDLEIAVITTRKPSDEQKCPRGSICYYEIEKWNFGALNKLKSIISLFKPNIIHYQHPSKNYGKSLSQFLIPWLLRRNMKEIKWLTTMHEFSESPVYAKPWLKLLAKFSDYLVFTTNCDQRYAVHKLNSIMSVSKVIPIGTSIIPTNIRSQELSALKTKILNNNKFLLGYFGFISRDKGLDDLINAYYRLKIKNKKPFQLIIIGQLIESDKYHRYILSLIKKLSLQNDIVITGYLVSEKVSQFLSVIDLCILPFKQGASLRRSSMLAALAHSTPVVTKYGPAAELLKDRESIAYYKKSDELDMVIESLYYDKELYLKIKNGTKAVAISFDWSKIANDTINYYKEIVNTD